ncbi:MAG: hypothetical protein GXO26_08770 [Crenarchaeota archaeon]|nr:hypothetical protein [Thermoproteota archaeon]
MSAIRVDPDVKELLDKIQIKLREIKGKRVPYSDIVRLALHLLTQLEEIVGEEIYHVDLSSPKEVEKHTKNIITKIKTNKENLK